jgi:hypothetical protein
MHGIAALVAVALGAAAPAAAQQTRTAEPGARPPAATLADLAWLEGTWTGDGFGARLTETYTAAAAGQMAGHFSAVKDGKADFYEFVMMAEVGDSLEYRVRHFNPDMTAWEDKATFVRFPLVAVEKDAWYFDGYTLQRTGPDTAVHIVRVKRGDGKPGDVVLPYRRVKP